MRKIVFHLHTGYAGMDTDVAYLVPDDVTNEELDDRAYWEAVEHASHYGIYPPCDEDEEDEPEYSGENIEGSWHLYTDKDKGKLTYGANDEIEWNEY